MSLFETPYLQSPGLQRVPALKDFGMGLTRWTSPAVRTQDDESAVSSVTHGDPPLRFEVDAKNTRFKAKKFFPPHS